MNIKLLVLFLIVTGSALQSFSQNLVPDPSFEMDTVCPQAGVMSDNAYWKNPTAASPDYLDSCSSNSQVSVPNNVMGSQNARTGGAYVGMITKVAGDYKEYVRVRLTDTLQRGKLYCVKLYVSLAGKSAYATTGPQAFFSPTAISSTSTSYLSYTPQVSGSAIISDTTNWILISGTYNAAGGEGYITIGNFYSDANTQSSLVYPFNGVTAYYYIDDISVTDCSNSGVDELTFLESISIYPNPSNGILKIKTELKNYSVEIFNVLGENVYQSANIKSEIDFSNRENGVYYLHINSGNKSATKKIIICK